MFQEGDRVYIPGPIYSSRGRRVISKQYGVIQRINSHQYYVKVNGDKGFIAQDGCWILTEEQIKKAPPQNNESAVSFLKIQK